MTNYSILLFSIVTFSILQSCGISFEKRLYRKGYHIETNTNQKRGNQYVKNENRLNFNNDIKPIKLFNQKSENNITDYVNSNHQFTQNNLTNNEKKDDPVRKLNNNITDECDIITLKNGDEIEASIIKISYNEIEYKNCNNPSGPTFVLKNSEVLIVKLKNGENYIPKNTNDSSINKSSQSYNEGEKPKKNNGALTALAIVFAVLWLAFFLLGLFVIALLFYISFGLLALALIFMFCAIFIK